MNQKSKRQARAERKHIAAAKKAEKNARLVTTVVQENIKKPRKNKNPDSIFAMHMSWCLDYADRECSWSWGCQRDWTEAEWAENIKPKLDEWSKLTWKEIDEFSSDTGHKMHHNMDCDVICEEAQLRLLEIELDGDVIFRFRLGNKLRLWGFRKLQEFQIVWYDRQHKIYPTDPD
ncbi:hypothetical protein [Paramylibacter kogurei]|uniref:hypothetical protein n=1 Tax=Paramylibacter kogurei TaxID=1889778 RepID=UPI00105448FB|nr:hypothetical protein [Amylibacter kogurei]